MVEGRDLLGFDDHDGLSRDGVHPSDHGFSVIADRLLPVLQRALAVPARAPNGHSPASP
jgi:lysophospholipase L1-like esterase